MCRLGFRWSSDHRLSRRSADDVRNLGGLFLFLIRPLHRDNDPHDEDTSEWETDWNSVTDALTQEVLDEAHWNTTLNDLAESASDPPSEPETESSPFGLLWVPSEDRWVYPSQPDPAPSRVNRSDPADVAVAVEHARPGLPLPSDLPDHSYPGPDSDSSDADSAELSPQVVVCDAEASSARHSRTRLTGMTL